MSGLDSYMAAGAPGLQWLEPLENSTFHCVNRAIRGYGLASTAGQDTPEGTAALPDGSLGDSHPGLHSTVP